MSELVGHNTPLHRVLTIIRVVSKTDTVFNGPRRFLKRLNYLEYRKDLKSHPDAYVPTDEYIAKHPNVPKKLLRFHYWGTIAKCMDGFTGESMKDEGNAIIRAATQRRVYLWTQNRLPDGFISKFYLSWVNGNELDDETYEIVKTSACKSDLKYWMSYPQAFFSGQHPFVDTIRLMHYLGEINTVQYTNLFEEARSLDENLKEWEGLASGQGAGTYKALNPDIESMYGIPELNGFWKKYGKQYVRPFNLSADPIDFE